MTKADPLERLLVAVMGEAKSTKTSFALTFPKPMVDFDLDQSFERCEARFRALYPDAKILKLPPGAELLDGHMAAFDLIVRQYRLPITLPGRAPTGMKELWDDHIINEIVRADENPRIKTCMIDTGTVLWEVNRMAHLQRTNDRSEKERERLIRIEYARPNTEARSLLSAARFTSTNLIVTHHVKGKYGPGMVENKRGEMELKQDQLIGETLDGYKETNAIVDITARVRSEITCEHENVTFIDNEAGRAQHGAHKINETPVPALVINECGYALSAQGKKITTPSFDSLLALVNERRDADAELATL